MAPAPLPDPGAVERGLGYGLLERYLQRMEPDSPALALPSPAQPGLAARLPALLLRQLGDLPKTPDRPPTPIFVRQIYHPQLHGRGRRWGKPARLLRSSQRPGFGFLG